MRWYTSDTHFGHERIIELSERPFDGTYCMNESMVYLWNNLVSPEDTVYHLGDVALGPWEEWDGMLSRLNGYKILVTGNHDRVFRGNKPKYIDKFLPEYGKWFDEIHDNIEGHWLDDGTIVNMSHFPYDGDSHDGDRYSEYRLPDRGRVLIHGHSHSSSPFSLSKTGTKQIHVGVDAWNYRPVSEDEIIDLINKGV